MNNYLKLGRTILIFAIGTLLPTSCSSDYDERITNLENAPNCYTTADFLEFLKKEISTQTAEQTAKIEECTSKIGSIQQNLFGAQGRLSFAEGELAVLKERADHINEQLSQLDSVANSEIDIAKQAAINAQAAVDKAQADVDILKINVDKYTSDLNGIRNNLDNIINEIQSNVAIKNVEQLANGDIKVTYKNANGNLSSFITSNVACQIDKTTGIVTFTINGTNFSVPMAKQFISSIVIVSGTYIDVAKQHKINVVFNTTDGKVLESNPNPASFKIYQGLTTRSTALENCPLQIASIVKAVGSPVQNEYEVAFVAVDKEYTGLHLGWKVSTSQEVMSPAFRLIQIPIAKQIYLNGTSGTIQTREQHSHSGTGCSNLPVIDKGTSQTFTVDIRMETGESLAVDKYASTNVEVLKFDVNTINATLGNKDVSVKANAQDRSYYIVYDIDSNGSANGLDGSLGTAHLKGFDYDYYNGNKVSYNQDKNKITAFGTGTPSYFDTTSNDITVISTSANSFSVAVGNSATNGMYAVVIMIKRTDEVYARGIAYLWVE